MSPPPPDPRHDLLSDPPTATIAPPLDSPGTSQTVDADTWTGVGRPGGRGRRAGTEGGRRFGPSLGAPNARAVVGGSLVAVAMVGAFLLAGDGDPDRGVDRVVASRDIEPGSVIEPDDLTTARLQMPEEVDRTAFGNVDELIGTVVLGPVGRGEVIGRSTILVDARPGGDGPQPELSVTLDADRALGGALRGGDRVDVVATYGSGIDASTRLAASDAVVVSSNGGEDRSLGPAGTVTVTLSLSSEDVMAVAHAAEAGEMRLVRTTGSDVPLAERYEAGEGDDGRGTGAGAASDTGVGEP